MKRARLISILSFAILFAPGESQAAIDQYGGNDALAKGAPTGVFHVQRIGDRWFLIDPIGNAMFTRAIDGVNDSAAGEGSVIAYDAVYLSIGTDAASFTTNLSTQGLTWGLPNDPNSPLNRDVIHPARAASLSQIGDTIYLGARVPPISTYFWLDQKGQGGHIEWFYSTDMAANPAWKPLSQASQLGNPASAYQASYGEPIPLNADGSFNLDIGGYMAPNLNGDGDWSDKNPYALNANLIKWWDTYGQGMPGDFSPVPLTAANGTGVDATPLYYIKGVVTRAFATPPVINQVYERDYLADIIGRKYGGGGGDATLIKWANTTTSRLRNWGLNATYQYSNRYAGYTVNGNLTNPVPVNDTWQLGSWVTRPNNMPSGYLPFKIKSVWGNVNTTDLNWQGMQPDAFEPGYESAMMQIVKNALMDPNKGVNYLKYTYQLVPEEGDHMYGFDSMGHQHMGYVVLVQNPYEIRNCNYNNGCEDYTNPMVYSRYAMRDFLRYKYRDPSDTIPPLVPGSRIPFYSYTSGNTLPMGLELKALQKLNAAWGTSYTTWGTSSGDLLLGTNAWGPGSGFMDEDGRHFVNGGHIYYGDSSSISSRVLPDLDNYVAFFAAQYGYILSKAFSQAPHPPIIMPLYGGPDYIFRNLSPYIDGYSVSISSPDALRLYNAGHKPLFTEDYSVANPDSQLFYKVAIDSVTWDPATQTTWVHSADLIFKFRERGFVYFPEPAVDACIKSMYHQNPARTYYRPMTSDTLGIDEDDHACIHPGTLMQWGSYDMQTQPDRAKSMMNRWGSMFNLQGDDGAHFVLGLDHWMLGDDDPTYWAETGNFGLVSNLDNAYDGIEARRSTTTVNTYSAPTLVGGEPADYGNLLTQPVTMDVSIPGLANPISLVDFWKSFDNGIVQVDTTVPVPPDNPTGLLVSSVQDQPPAVSLKWNANPSWENISGYTIYFATYSLLEFSPSSATVIPSITRQAAGSGTSASVSVPISDAYYFFRLTATNAAGESPFSNEVSTTPHPHVAPSIPTGLKVTGTQEFPAGITLAWKPNPSTEDLSGYMVYYSSTNSMAGLTPTQASTTSWVRIFSAGDVTTFPMTNLGNNQLYYIRITAYNPFGESDFSTEVSTGTPIIFPSTPTAFALTGTTSQPQPTASFSWALNVSTDFVTGYTIYVATQSLLTVTTGQAQAMGVRRVSAGLGSTFQVTGLLNDVTYYFRLSASNLGGESPFSNELSTNTDPSGNLPAPTLNLPATLPVNAVISAGYSPLYALSGFQWTISQTGSAGGSGSIALASGFSASFPTPTAQAALAPLALNPGTYTITVKAVDTAGHISPPAQASVNLIANDLGIVRVYPNPWRADRAVNPYITFDQLPLNSIVKIYTLSGRGMVSIPSALDPVTSIVTAKWDLKTDSGEKAASGLYLYLITDDQGDKRKGQLAIIR